MIPIHDSTTMGEAFFQAAERYASNRLLAAPANPARRHAPTGREITYAEAANTVRGLMAQYRAAGYGLGHRVGLFLESRPEHMLHKLALNRIGLCCVPIKPDYRARALAYVMDHAKVDLIVALASRLDAARAALALTLALAQHQAPSPLERDGFPLLEPWGMTEMVRPLCDNHAPRQIGPRAFGRARPALDACVMDEGDPVVPDDTPGELVVPYFEAKPRRHFFSGYLDNP